MSFPAVKLFDLAHLIEQATSTYVVLLVTGIRAIPLLAVQVRAVLPQLRQRPRCRLEKISE